MDKSKVVNADTVYFKCSQNGADASTQEHIYSQLDNTEKKQLPVYINCRPAAGKKDKSVKNCTVYVIIALSVAFVISNAATGLTVYYTTHADGGRGCTPGKSDDVIDGETTTIITAAIYPTSTKIIRIWSKETDDRWGYDYKNVTIINNGNSMTTATTAAITSSAITKLSTKETSFSSSMAITKTSLHVTELSTQKKRFPTESTTTAYKFAATDVSDDFYQRWDQNGGNGDRVISTSFLFGLGRFAPTLILLSFYE